MHSLFRSDVRRLLLAILLLGLVRDAVAQLPPQRSTRFDGSATARIGLPSAFYAPSNTLTLEAWVYREDASRCETVVAQNYTTSFWFGFCSDRLRFYRQGGAAIDAARTVPSRRWTHIAVVYNPTLPAASNSVAFYIDGIGAGVANPRPATTPLNLPLYLGSTPGSLLASFPFHGALDEVRLWSVPRTVEQIRADRFRELVAEPGLVAVFPGGGTREVVEGRNAVQVTGATPQTFGILPRDLVVPRIRSPITLDGQLNDPAYAGAEVLAVRYPSGTNEFDLAARLVVAPSASSQSDFLHVGIPRIESGSSATVLSARPLWRVYLDGARGESSVPRTNDLRFAYDAYDTGARTVAGGSGTGTFGGTNAAPGAFTAVTESGVEFDAPSVEFRFQPQVILPAPFGDPRRGFMMDLHDPFVAVFLPGFTRVAPFDAVASDTGTWPEITLGATVGAVAIAEFRLTVLHPDRTNAPLAGARIAVWNAANRTLITRGTTGARGTVELATFVPTNVPIQLQLELPANWRFADPPRIDAGLPRPLATTLATVDFPGCSGTTCTYPPVTFFALDPPAAGATAVFTDIDPRDADSALLLRDSPRQVLPAGTLNVRGAHFDRGIRVWTVLESSSCLAPPGTGDPDPLDNFPGCSWRLNEPLSRSPAAIQFQLQYTNAVARTVRVWLYNSWNGRWITAPAATVSLGEPPYPLVHGFSFENYRDGHDIDDYRAAFPGIVCDPFKMIGFWAFFPIYLDLFGEGECVGMVTSSHFLRGSVAPASFRAGVQRTAGFLPADNAHPSFDVGNPCAPRPTSLRAFIRSNHGVQSSSQFLGETLAQLQLGFSGAPAAEAAEWGGVSAGLYTPMEDRLREIRAGPTRKLVCIKPDFLGSGHALLPLAVRATALAHVQEVDVYDPNHPGETRVLRVNTRDDRFAYDGFETPWRGAYLFVHDIPRFWGGGRDIISIDTLGAALDHFGGRGLLELLGLLVSGDAEPLLSFPDGTAWGWRADRSAVNTATHIAEIPDFGRLLRPVDPLGHGPAQVFFNPAPSLPTIDLHARGERYHFQLGHGGHLFQILAEQRVPGDRDQVRLLVGADFLRPGTTGSTGIPATDALQGFQFLTGRAGARFTPRIALGRGGSNTLALFAWSGLSNLAAGTSLRFGVDAVRNGALLVNDSGIPLQAGLTLLTPPATGTSPVTNQLVLPPLPAGAALGSYLLATAPGQPARLRFELDRNRDRVPESQWILAPDATPLAGAPSLTARLEGGRVLLAWPLAPAPWWLVSAEHLDGPWLPASVPLTLGAREVTAVLPASDTPHRFFRLANSATP